MPPDSDDHLVRYLLGDLPEGETERLDEQSVTDETFALRLRELENDLADRYARGEPLDPSLQRFDQRYRDSAHLRDKVRFAAALHTLTAAPATPVNVLRARGASRRLWLQGLAAAAVVLLAVAGYLAFRMMRLGDELERLEGQRVAIERRTAELQQEMARTRVAPARIPAAATTFLLRPPRRGLENRDATISVPRGTEQLTLRLIVESDDYVTFWAAVRSPAANRIVWRSADLPAAADGADRIVTVTVPLASLQSGQFSVELAAVTGRGATEVVGNYPIRVVLE